MYRKAFLLISLATASCAGSPGTIEADADPAEAEVEVEPNLGAPPAEQLLGAVSLAAGAREVGDMGALPNVPACYASIVCVADADCAAYPGNYCQTDVCALHGSLRGQCRLTKVQGQACARDGECVSQRCDCTEGADACVCAPQDGPPDFHGP